MHLGIKSSGRQGPNNGIRLLGWSRGRSGELTRAFLITKAEQGPACLSLEGGSAIGLLAVLPHAQKEKRKMPVFWFEEQVQFTWAGQQCGKSPSRPGVWLRMTNGACTEWCRLHTQ